MLTHLHQERIATSDGAAAEQKIRPNGPCDALRQSAAKLEEKQKSHRALHGCSLQREDLLDTVETVSRRVRRFRPPPGAVGSALTEGQTNVFGPRGPAPTATRGCGGPMGDCGVHGRGRRGGMTRVKSGRGEARTVRPGGGRDSTSRFSSTASERKAAWRSPSGEGQKSRHLQKQGRSRPPTHRRAGCRDRGREPARGVPPAGLAPSHSLHSYCAVYVCTQ